MGFFVNISGPEIIFSSLEIRSAVNGLSDNILIWLKESNAKSLNVIPVLEGSRKFAQYVMDLLRIKMTGLQVFSYPLKVKATAGTLLLSEPVIEGDNMLPNNLAGDPVLIIDDLLDSGKTISFVKALAVSSGATDIKTAVLVNKFIHAGSRADFVCFDLALDKRRMKKEGIKDLWVFGFGMDLNGRFRDSEDIWWVPVK